MERQRFDDITRSMARGASRRGVLKTLAGSAAGGLAILIGGTAHAAVNDKDKGGGKGGKVKPECCPADRPRLCGGITCGACCADDHCPSGQVCTGGACVAPKPSCTDGIRNGTETDVDCGGGCPGCDTGERCDVGADCASGVCQANVCFESVCQPGATRPCGSDIGACRFGIETCSDNGSGWGPCLGGVGPQPETCNHVDDDCDGVVDNGACPAMHHATYACGETSDGLGCVVSACDPGWGDCDSDPANGCETDTRMSPVHCGACERICPTDPNGTSSCTNGACALVCNPGYTLAGDRCQPVALVGVSVAPGIVTVGATANGTVHLNVPAPVAATIGLSVDRPIAAVVPASIVVSAGQTSASFPVQGLQASGGPVRLTATLGQSQMSTTFTVV